MDIKELRERIDTVNREMAKLFNERMKISADIARYKQENGLPVLDRERERSILSQMAALTDDDIGDYTARLFRTLFDLSRAYQQSLIPANRQIAEKVEYALQNTPKQFPGRAVVACQGVEGAYSQLACDKVFENADIMYFQQFEGVFQAVESGMCQYGMLPIENSSYGSVADVYDLMKKHKFYIVRGIKLRISHMLLTKNGVKLSQVKEVFSHGQAIGQCSEFLKAHPEIKVTPCANTAIAAKMVAESERNDVAAISSASCAELYGLSVASDAIQNNSSNYTRFICISRDMQIFPGASRISLMMTLPHRPGSLSEMLSRFSVMGINLTKLESRPAVGKEFEFMFYFDLETSVLDDGVLSLLCELESTLDTCIFLGNYTEI